MIIHLNHQERKEVRSWGGLPAFHGLTIRFNPWRGCTRVSPGCTNCYAERDSKRFPDLRGRWGPEKAGGTRTVAAEGAWKGVERWDREASNAPSPRRIFCASLADWLEDWTGPIHDHRGDVVYVKGDGSWGAGKTGPPTAASRLLTMNDMRARLLDLIERTPNLDWLLLSKRPENWDRLLRAAVAAVPASNGRLDAGVALGSAWLCGAPPLNVVLMTTAENQEYAGRRLPLLLQTPALRYGVSVEPQLGRVDLTPWLDKIHWVISGGESGPGARPFDLAWARSLRDQCAGPGSRARFFLKQLGDNPYFVHDDPPPAVETFFKPPGRHGADTDLWPRDLVVQDFYEPVIPSELEVDCGQALAE